MIVKSHSEDVSPAGGGAQRAGVDIQSLQSTYPGFIFHYTSVDWGGSIKVMQKDGYGFGRAYWFNDDPHKIFLGWVSVSPENRKNGLGLTLQLIREDIGRQIGARYSFLYAKKRSWMSRWYKRRGYRWYAKYEDNSEMMWMRKKL